ncbi:MAG TPA: DUF4386 domain-containing protein [Bacteroidales bacterium]|nr:DUF4386 domain-containing protein [Bacteroidales bacterium]
MKDKNNPIKIYNARIIGLFISLAFVAYGLGRQFFDSTDNLKYLGALLIIVNSIMVLFIGILLRKTLKLYNPTVGNIYLFTRIFEALALASIVLTLLPTVNISKDLGYNLGMLVLGIGSIPMCLTLLKHKITPAWLAIWGAIGYAIFTFGIILDLFGKEMSIYFLAPGAIWEITFALWLIVRGSKNIKPTTR